MPDWVQTLTAVIVTAIVAPILVRRFVPAWQRRKTEAEADSEVAETVVALTVAYDKLLTATQEHLQIAEAGIDIRDEKIRNLEQEYNLIHEQYIHAGAYLAAATAQIALYEGRALINHEAEHTQGENDE